MIAGGLEHGAKYSAEYFEQRLKLPRTHMKFSLAVTEIRKLLEIEGFYLDGHGQNGGYVITPIEKQETVLQNKGKAAMEELRRAAVLGANSRVHLLEGEARRRLESRIEKTQIKLALLSRSKHVARIVMERKPGLLGA
jgi:hypothetical protein